MTLPDASRLSTLSDDVWRGLGARLDALGLHAGASHAATAAVKRLPTYLRRPLLQWHFRRAGEPWAAALRMLAIQDAVTEQEASSALGPLLARLLDAGLLERTDGGGVVSPYVLHSMGGLYLLADDLAQGGHAVMALSTASAALAGAALPGEGGSAPPLERGLDLGCGGGALALRLSRRARRVVATDVNPRALTLARVNAAINGVTNIDFREGSLFEPVRGETFDVILSQPPFVPMPAGAQDTPFLYGGPRGDEVALALLAGIEPHLATRGRAVLMVEWPELDEEPLSERARRAVGPDALDVLVLKAPSMSPDEHAGNYAASLHPRLGPEFERDATERREHLERQGIRGLGMTLVALSRAEGRSGWTDQLEVRSPQALHVTSDRLDRLISARALASRRELLLAARLRVPEGMTFTQREEADGEALVSVSFPEGSLCEPLEMSADLLGALTAIHEAPDVHAGISRFAGDCGVPLEEALDQLVPALEQALRRGLLETT